MNAFKMGAFSILEPAAVEHIASIWWAAGFDAETENNPAVAPLNATLTGLVRALKNVDQIRSFNN
ncbi:MAG: hypothetical protein GXP16_03465 [Gammaproteobacteria bacterium]|nr:hypothetical protein [Gammaproteobacteria bacterium]